MATSKDYIDVDLEEKRIRRIILNVQTSRNRACYQNILSFAKRENQHLDMEIVKDLIRGMVEKNIIFDKNKGIVEKESFKLFRNPDDQDEISTQTYTEVDSFHEDVEITRESPNDEELIHNKIKDEVKHYINDNLMFTLGDLIKAEIEQKFVECKKRQVVKDECTSCDDNLLLTATLNDHIAFLQKELDAKNSIIEMIINDKSNTKSFNSCKGENVKTTVHNERQNNKGDIYESRDKQVKLVDRNKKINVDVNKHDTYKRSEGTHVDQNCTRTKDPEREQSEFQSQHKKTKNKRCVTIVGDSLIKDVKGYEMKKLLPKNTKVYVRPESGAIVEDMIDYINPTRKHKPDLYIFHAGTNDLRTGKDPERIADEIIKVAKSLKTNENDVAISAIVYRNDDLNEKGKQVNEYLKLKLREHKLGLIEHNNIFNLHMNGSNLHLNEDGVKRMKENFASYIKL